MSFMGDEDDAKEQAKEGGIIEFSVNDKDVNIVKEALAGS